MRCKALTGRIMLTRGTCTEKCDRYINIVHFRLYIPCVKVAHQILEDWPRMRSVIYLVTHAQCLSWVFGQWRISSEQSCLLSQITASCLSEDSSKGCLLGKTAGSTYQESHVFHIYPQIHTAMKIRRTPNPGEDSVNCGSDARS